MTTKSANEMRLFLGFLSLPFAAAGFGYIGFPLFARSLLRQVGGSFSNDGAASFALATAVVAFVVMILGALPLVSMMLKCGLITFIQALIAGVLLSNTPFLIVSALIVIGFAFAGTPGRFGGVTYGLAGFVRTMTTSTLIGAALGSLFWFVALRGREAAVST